MDLEVAVWCLVIVTVVNLVHGAILAYRDGVIVRGNYATHHNDLRIYREKLKEAAEEYIKLRHRLGELENGEIRELLSAVKESANKQKELSEIQIKAMNKKEES